jgi:hypothetical protein
MGGCFGAVVTNRAANSVSVTMRVQMFLVLSLMIFAHSRIFTAVKEIVLSVVNHGGRKFGSRITRTVLVAAIHY